MAKRIPKERLIFSNYGDMYTDDDLRESLMCNDEDLRKEDITDEMLWKERDFLEQIDFEDMMYNLKHFFDTESVILFGSIGRWNGTHSGAQMFDSFEDAYNWAMEDCGYVKLYDENGHFFIHCSHHDGSCTFEVKVLNDDAQDFYDRWSYGNDSRTEWQVIESIIKRHSKLPHYCHKEWGSKKQEYEPQSKEAFTRLLNNQARSFYM